MSNIARARGVHQGHRTVEISGSGHGEQTAPQRVLSTVTDEAQGAYLCQDAVNARADYLVGRVETAWLRVLAMEI